MELLKISKVAVAYQGKKVLQNITFSMQKKEVICVIGESGCGKTTLLKAIQGLLDCSTGSMSFNGKAIEGASEKLVPGTEGIATVYQDFNLEENLSVYQNIQRELRHLKKPQQEKITKSLLKACQIQNLADRFPKQISGGQRQKVALAKALIAQPELILLDEPFSNLDAISKQNFKDLINELKNSKDLSFLYVTHDISDALTFADRIIILEKGKMVVNCPTENLFKEIKSLYIAKILGLKNTIKGSLLNAEFRLHLFDQAHYWIPFAAIQITQNKKPNFTSLKAQFLGDENQICFAFSSGFSLQYKHTIPLPMENVYVEINPTLLIQLH